MLYFLSHFKIIKPKSESRTVYNGCKKIQKLVGVRGAAKKKKSSLNGRAIKRGKLRKNNFFGTCFLAFQNFNGH